ncbi:TonB-dependent receptor domain-containing protein [Pseudohongiella spirulinae]|uniref:TonB-dependent receptor-like protein n=1 Tax=Pseudohongiella spirulinae TaxID=1249552 RepID=A0A0S2KGI5_9GAMM|nr:TonB-dependent receptor [Pseudohongiella spirulinae]ALO47416.1 TonB-dependent receptor-like protein [Pseudohongiella spirulinae]
MKKKYMHICMQARSASFVGASAIAAMLSANGALAQQTDGDTRIEEVVVTGSLITRSGYEAPTPVSALDEEAFDQMPVTQIGELVERLPVFQGSQNARNNVSVSDGTSGTNLLDLRGLGPNRTLILLDGKRVVGASIGGARGGAVDVSNLPSGLVRRVEVTTGGASATYGADALAGVVNFMLDKDYTGFKARFQGSRTTKGDGDAYVAGFSGGMEFADSRGHFLIDVERGYDEGIQGKPRSWAEGMTALVPNPAYASDNSQPFYTIIDNAGLERATYGGLILSCSPAGGGACPLRGTQFTEGGVPAPFEFGSIVSGIWMSGGDWETSTLHRVTGLSLEQERDNLFLRTSYDLTDSTTVYGEFMYGDSLSTNPATAFAFRLGNITIRRDNPFIPQSVQDQMDANGITSFRMGSVNGDGGNIQFQSRRKMTRFVLGAEGEVAIADTPWSWDASFVSNWNDVQQKTPNNLNNAKYNLATDVVLDSNGNPACRINVDSNPANDDPACAPYNNMGLGVASPEALAYAYTTGWMNMRIKQEMVSGSMSGDPIENWAGPVSVAFGASYRTEEVGNSASSAEDRAGVLTGGNYNPTFGDYDVTEFYAETVIPLLADDQLDLNGAFRWTDYSTSGDVDTWKVGLSWRPTDDLRIRATRSRDIRAPSLGDLFDAGTSGTGTIRDPFLGVESQVVSQTRGNPNIQPEIGDTTGLGFVYQPSWLPEFAMSLDYYDIEVEDAILSIGGQAVVDRCFDGDEALCNSIVRDPGNNQIVQIFNQPQNVLSQRAAGYDLEMSYRFPLSNISSNLAGDLSFRALFTYVDTLETNDGVIVADGVGKVGPSIGAPSFGLNSAESRFLSSVTYANGPLDVTFTARGLGAGVYDNRYIECAPGSCPVSTAANPTVNNNSIESITYFDLGFNYALENGKVFMNFQNVFDRNPAAVASTSFWSGPGNMTFYERMGRIVRVGLDYEF